MPGGTVQPSIGSVVHYVSYGTPVREDGWQRFAPRCRAATITETSDADDTVGLMVANPTGLFFQSLLDGGVLHVEDKATGAEHYPGGSWHYPCPV